jgi:hypothetical protein
LLDLIAAELAREYIELLENGRVDATTTSLRLPKDEK